MTADTVGGVWRYATDLARALVPHGIETTIAILEPISPSPSGKGFGEGKAGREQVPNSPRPTDSVPHPNPSPEGEGLSIIHTGLPLDWLCDSPEPVLHAGQAIADLARDLRADMVQLNSPTLAAAAHFPAPVIAVAHGCTATWWTAAHGTAPDPAYRWHADLMRAGLLSADATVAPSRSFAADLQRIYALPTAPQAVHNGRASPSALRGEGRVEGRSRTPTSDPAPHALTAGRLWDRVKNTAVLDRAAARLSAPVRAAGPVAGPHGETVRPDHLHLLGTLSADALAAELARRPVFVSATGFEPFGLAVLEAAAAGCALVLSDIPTFRELWDGAAVFVPAQDDAAIAAAIEALLAEPDRRDEFSHAARARAACYTTEANAAAMAALYAGLLSTRRAAA